MSLTPSLDTSFLRCWFAAYAAARALFPPKGEQEEKEFETVRHRFAE